MSGGAPEVMPCLLAPILDADEALFALPLFPIATLLGAAFDALPAPAAAFREATRPATPVLLAEADGDVERPFEVLSDNGAAAARASVDIMILQDGFGRLGRRRAKSMHNQRTQWSRRSRQTNDSCPAT